MPEVLQIASNAVNAKLIGASRDTKLIVSELLSYDVEGADRSATFKSGAWDGRSSFFDFSTGVFPAGFVYMVGRCLEKGGHRVQRAMKAIPEPLGPAVGTHDPMGFGFSERYEYQPETIRRLLRHGRMIATVATGGGKSNIAALCYSTIRRPTLFLTTRSVLMHQMRHTFENCGFHCGVIGDGVWEPRKGINVGMVQSIMARLKEGHPQRARTLALLNFFEVVIGEEAHEVGGSGYFDIMGHCKSAMYRLALTATPFMREGAESNMRLQAAFGSIGIQISEKLLIDRGILAKPYFKIAESPRPPMLRTTTRWPACYDIGIVENFERNKTLVYEGLRAAKFGLSTMTLVQREKHGVILQEMFTKAGVRSVFIFGKHEQSDRKQALSDLKDRRIDVLIGSTIMDVGVDVPAVGMVQIAGAGKAEVGTRQRIGRGLREKKSGANICRILDFSDKGNRYLKDHAASRRAIIESTPGFSEGLLAENADYPS